MIVDVKKCSTPIEFFDIDKVFEFGSSKYDKNNWLTENGLRCSEHDMFASMVRHLAGSTKRGFDSDSGLDHLLHLAARALMLYTRRKRGIIHELDKK